MQKRRSFSGFCRFYGTFFAHVLVAFLIVDCINAGGFHFYFFGLLPEPVGIYFGYQHVRLSGFVFLLILLLFRLTWYFWEPLKKICSNYLDFLFPLTYHLAAVFVVYNLITSYGDAFSFWSPYITPDSILALLKQIWEFLGLPPVQWGPILFVLKCVGKFFSLLASKRLKYFVRCYFIGMCAIVFLMWGLLLLVLTFLCGFFLYLAPFCYDIIFFIIRLFFGQ